ncbi:hypothetical protein UFOVP211_45 [uncultured Caudovirales phage]|uniref:Uncharacterized protein n=1 Tax=uncultured Caudovirales phage TaxID=2100421 RepID=A0A6J7WKQ6_9CAUD|nr:hypothetical protein UFOVP211_45 [uncultured Caudovirales phage]
MKQVDKFLKEQLEDITAKIQVVGTQERFNTVDYHFLVGLLMGINYLLEQNGKGKTKK